MILDLGCGTNKVVGAFGIDNAALPGVDLVHNLLATPYPLQAGCATEIYLNHVIEHFVLADYQRILQEAYRLLASDGLLYVRVPHVYSVAAWSDPTHKAMFTFLSGQFFDARADKAYYQETDSIWILEQMTARVTWFNWKRYRLRQLDNWLSGLLARLLDWLLTFQNWPGAADLMVKAIPMFFVEIRWTLRKAQAE